MQKTKECEAAESKFIDHFAKPKTDEDLNIIGSNRF